MLKGVISECDVLESLKRKNAYELDQLAVERREAIALADAAKTELRWAIDIFASKPHIMFHAFGPDAPPELVVELMFLSGAFPDLPRSMRDACQHFGDHEESSIEKAFWV